MKKIITVRILTRSIPIRWLSYIRLFQFEVSHVRGDDIEFTLTDLMSRSKKPKQKNGFFTIGDLRDEELLIWKSDVENKYAIYSILFEEYLKPMDNEYIRNQIKVKQFTTGFDDSRENVRILKEKVDFDGKLKEISVRYLRDKLLVPPEYIEDLLTLTHNHQSPTSWYQNIRKLGIETKNLHKRIFNYARSCVVCQSQHAKKDIFRKTTVNVTDEVGETGHVDVLHLNSEKFLNLIDRHSGYVWSERVENETEKCLSEILMKMIFASGIIFNTLVTDNHASFRGKLLEDFTTSMNIRLIHTASRNPRGNGKVERVQGSIVKHVKLLQNIQLPTWLVVQMSCFLINNSEDKTHGLTPFEVIYLRGNKFPTNVPSLSISKLKSFKPITAEFYKAAIEVLSQIKEKQLKKLSEVEKITMYNVGDIVLLKNYRIPGKSDKILPAYSTKLYKIIKKNPFTHTYEIEKIENDQRISRQRQKVHHRIVKKISKRISFDKEPSEIVEKKSSSMGELQNPDKIEVQSENNESKTDRIPPRYNLRSAKSKKF